MTDVVAFSFLPKAQGQGGQFAGHRQTDQFRLASGGHPLQVELLPGAGLVHGHPRRRLENFFQLPLMIGIQSSDRRGLARTLQLAVDERELGADARHQTQAHVSPEEALAAEAEGRLDQG